METGEHYLCHPYFKKIPQQTPVFVLSPATAVPGLTVCRFVCVMPVLSVSTPISAALKKQIANRLTALSKSVSGVAEKDSRRCLKCPRLTLTKSQLYIIDAIKTGMNNQQIAQELGISHKTVFHTK
ncbi:LuxR C-terminal-related transcriptional regulator [Klebsiella variicola subsp. variicola]|nr:LuxR C-terminal-related transcriptional regulator [Klebsiella variicola subsp. variicola]